jgi:hypothetical protein
MSDLVFTSETDLEALAAEHGYRYERSADEREEFVVRDDGTIVIRRWRVAINMRGAKRKGPSVWMRSINDHTYQSRPQPPGAIYLAYQDDMETILNQKFAVLDTPPPKAVR